MRIDSEPRFLIGVMCGTSGDGIAGAVVETAGYGRDRSVRVLAHRTDPYPAGIRERLFRLFPPRTFTAFDLGSLHRDVGTLLADFCFCLLKDAGLPLERLLAVVVQAPTLIHQPPGEDELGFHLEVGEATLIAERVGTAVVCDLRPSDVAVGGHGAPLSAFVDFVLFSDPSVSRAIQNIGGIANVTYLPAGGSLDDTLAFDTGPGNMVIDEVVRRVTSGAEGFDRSGERAARGRVNTALLDACMAHPYVSRPLPKTTGREDFGAHFVDEVMARAGELSLDEADLVATVTVFTAECIRQHYERDLRPRGGVDEVVLYGGGVHNRSLVAMIEERVPGVRIRQHGEFGIDGDAREAVSWAILGDETLAGNPANVPSASGGSHPVVLGKVVRTRPWLEP